MKLIVGLTGGIGSGKSLVSHLFAEMGIYIIDADLIVHELSRPPSKALDEISQQFGEEYLTEEGVLNRTKIREAIFTAPPAQKRLTRKKLEGIFHPLVRERVLEMLQRTDISSPYIILSVPLLFESKDYTDIIDRALVVDCPVDVQIVRTMKRGLTLKMVKEIISSQMSREERLARADDVIDNKTDQIEALKNQVFALHHYYLQLSAIKR